ncbi:hypothetical protein BT93_E1639 [Corymbia citriodora subsp. variegata]|nr:hypothetical protein BT93_E1639 [Corymbia citriodora subsp. variegata]
MTSSSNPSLSTRSVSHPPPPLDFACSFSDSRWNQPSNEPRRRCRRIHWSAPRPNHAQRRCVLSVSLDSLCLALSAAARLALSPTHEGTGCPTKPTVIIAESALFVAPPNHAKRHRIFSRLALSRTLRHCPTSHSASASAKNSLDEYFEG